MKNKLFFTLLLIVGLVLLKTNTAFTQAGDLDKSFHENGKVITPTNGNTHSSYGESVAIKANGKIVVAGYETKDPEPIPEFSFNSIVLNRFVVVQYNSDGSLDNNFGEGGIVTTDFGYGSNAEGRSVAIQNWDQKIVVAGTADGWFALVRYTSAGIRDITFGEEGTGIVLTSFENSAQGRSVAINQSDHSIVVAGTSNNDFAVARYTSAGKPDNTFGDHGKKTIDFGFLGSGTTDTCNSVAIQSDGKIVLAGSSNNDFVVARLLKANGARDITFGSPFGYVTTNFGLTDKGYSVAIQSNGKIVVAGSTKILASMSSDFAVARYKSNGSLDSTFSADGKVTTGFEPGYNDYGTSVVIDGVGKIVIAGYSQNSDGSVADFAVARYTSTGILDNAFSGDGKVTTDFGFILGTKDYGHALAIQSNLRIVVAGTTVSASNALNRIAVARYHGLSIQLPLQSESDELSALNKVNAGASSALRLYPNPVTDILHVEGLNKSASTTISISDLSGKMIQRATAVNGNYTLNVKELPAGMYYISVVENKKITNLKFIKR